MKNILVTGGSGMVGKCLFDLVKNDTNNWFFISSKECDLTNTQKTEELFIKYKPDLIIHLAANVGGLYKNLRERTKMFSDNVRMNENVLEMSNKYNVQKGIFCLSSCIFPHSPSKYPMTENMLHESSPHPSNEGYGYAKRLLEVQCRNYNIQYNRQYICLIPVNLYGPYDNFNLDDSHVIPGIIHRMLLAQKNNDKFEIYGTGSPLRQFLYSYDFAKIILLTLDNYDNNKSIICSNDEISIKDLTYKICNIFKYDESNLTFDTTKNDGCLKKTVDNSYFKQIFPDFTFTSLDEGLEKTIQWFIDNYDSCRK